MAVNPILFWAGFGLAVRMMSLGMSSRPIWSRRTALGYPVYIGIGASFGYWMQNIHESQRKTVMERRQVLLEKRQRRAARGNATPDDAEATAAS